MQRFTVGLSFILSVFLGFVAMPLSAQQPVAQTSQGTVRAVFVGIDEYRYWEQGGFNNLKGAVADTLHIKQAFSEIYKLKLDTPQSGQCQSSNDISTTLTDDCATRKAILDALDKTISLSAPGDTVIFYFAGHGARYIDEDGLDQASGFNSTILPTDARQPNVIPGADILDTELKRARLMAMKSGINFVSIFDSCHSGTGTRDGVNISTRSAPNFMPTRFRPADPGELPAGEGAGYWVHLAAAQDEEEALEVGIGSNRAGVFTTELVEALKAVPHATYGDIIHEVQLRVASRGHVTQNPGAEGQLTNSFMGRARGKTLINAISRDGNITFPEAGTWTGMTVGSTYALFANQTDAIAENSIPLAIASITSVDRASSQLALAKPAPSSLPERLVALERVRKFATDIVTVGLRGELADDAAQFEQLVADTEFARIGPSPQVEIARNVAIRPEFDLVAADGVKLAELGNPKADEARFAARFKSELAKLARVEALLALRTAPDTIQTYVCIDDSDYGEDECPADEKAGRREVELGKNILITLRNDGDAPAYVYVLGIAPDNEVVKLIPESGAQDGTLLQGRTLRNSGTQFSLDAPGRYRFVTITTDRQIDADLFEQRPSGARGNRECISALERLLCQATDGRRGMTTADAPGTWAAQVTTVHAVKSAENCVDDETTYVDECNEGKRVIKGHPAPPGSAPWQVQIYSTNGYTRQEIAADARLKSNHPNKQFLKERENFDRQHRCGGSYIGGGWVVTAAHCVVLSYDGANVLKDRAIRTGTYSLAGGGQFYDIAAVVIHAGYSNEKVKVGRNYRKRHVHDIALIKLKGPNFPPPSAAIQLNTSRDRALRKNHPLVATGWGMTGEKSEKTRARLNRFGGPNFVSRGLQQAHLMYKLPRDCKQVSQIKARHINGTSVVYPTVICAGSPQGSDTCTGDSGGPLVVKQNRKRRLVGIVSWGVGCGIRGVPGLYTRVASYEKWIAAARKKRNRSRPYYLSCPGNSRNDVNKSC